jgi:hypothetical protein
MNENLLKFSIYIAGVICLYAFLAVRILPMYNAIMIEDKVPAYFEFTKYGEQYYYSCIRHFREDLPTPKDKYRFSDRNPDVNEADIFALGDSFFDFSRQKTVPERLHDSLGITVHAEYKWYPLDYLTQKNYQKAKRKYIIFQVVERNIHSRFIESHELNWIGNDYLDPSELNFLQRIRSWIFDVNSEELYTILLQGSYFTSEIYSAIATLKFDLFGYIVQRTPFYSLDNEYNVPMLFYDITVRDTPAGFYHNHSPELINTYCNNIEDLAAKMLEHYNLEMIFVPVPSKYTLYYDVIHPDHKYSNFLPKLYLEMEKRGIEYVNIYDDFLAADTLLYYGTDSHWNKKGVDITVDEILRKLRLLEPETFGTN